MFNQPYNNYGGYCGYQQKKHTAKPYLKALPFAQFLLYVFCLGGYLRDGVRTGDIVPSISPPIPILYLCSPSLLDDGVILGHDKNRIKNKNRISTEDAIS